MDGPSHQLYQFFGEGQAEACSTISAEMRFIGLRKGVKNSNL